MKPAEEPARPQVTSVGRPAISIPLAEESSFRKFRIGFTVPRSPLTFRAVLPPTRQVLASPDVTGFTSHLHHCPRGKGDRR